MAPPTTISMAAGSFEVLPMTPAERFAYLPVFPVLSLSVWSVSPLSTLEGCTGSMGVRTRPVASRGPPRRFRIMVSDNGPGLPPRAHQRLFHPFAGSARPGGTGLGLAIARDLVRAHGGDIRLDHSTADGTCFSFEIPIEQSKP